MRFNRTFLVLKSGSADRLVVADDRFNRTFLVLKYVASYTIFVLLSCFNRTFLVLKFRIGLLLPEGDMEVLIAPFWY